MLVVAAAVSSIGVDISGYDWRCCGPWSAARV